MWAMVTKEFRQLRRDHRTLAMMVVLPVLLLVVFGYAASFDVDDIPTSVVGPRAEEVAAALPPPFDVSDVATADDRSDAEEDLREGRTPAAVVTGENDEIVVLLDGSELFTANAARTALAAPPGEMTDTPAPEVDILYNEGLATSVVMVPALAGLILLFIGTVITSLGVVRERQTGTLEQLAVMPLRPRDVFLGKIAPYFVVATLDLLLVLGVGVWLFDVPFRGSALVLGLGALLFIFVTLGVGVLISTVSQNQGQAIQLAILTLLPQIMLSGMIFPLRSMAPGVQWISYLLPLTYFNEIMRGVMLRGASLASLWQSFLFLAVLGAAVVVAATLRFRQDLAPAHVRRPPAGAGTRERSTAEAGAAR
jgi:ABC-2 type transport system permease protein